MNANDYTRAEVPALLRSIYAYHTQSRGWSDIGYNYLVDRFGRIWEGRYGGIDRPVVGAHTLNYNDWSFAMSAIGSYDIKQPSRAMVEAYGALFAWKLRCTAWTRPRPKAVGRVPPPRRSTATATPRRPPAPVATSTPRSPRSAGSPPRPARLVGTAAGVQPGRDGLPRPGGAPGQRRPGLRHPDRRADRLHQGHDRRLRARRRAAGRRQPGRHRGRHR